MKAYLAICKIVLTSLLQYRAAALAKILTHLFWGMIHVMVLTAFYAGSTSPQPLSLVQAISMTWLGQILLQLLPWMIDHELEAQIKNGNVACELVRPLNLYWVWFCRSTSSRIIPALMHAIPFLAIIWTFFSLPLPPSLASGIAFCVSVCLAALLSGTMATVIVISFFWTLSGEGIKRLVPHTSLLLSGVIIPLPLFPSWTQPLLNAQPFRGIVDIPSRIYTGLIPAHDTYLYLGFQLLWSIGFIIVGKWLMERALKRFVVQGG